LNYLYRLIFFLGVFLKCLKRPGVASIFTLSVGIFNYLINYSFDYNILNCYIPAPI
jgi:hypothetical protein